MAQAGVGSCSASVLSAVRRVASFVQQSEAASSASVSCGSRASRAANRPCEAIEREREQRATSEAEARRVVTWRSRRRPCAPLTFVDVHAKS